MVAGFTILLVCQLIGEILARAFGLPVPGPVIGLVLLVAGLHWAHRRPQTPQEHLETLNVTRVANGLLANLSLLFVPAGVGVFAQAAILQSQALALGVSLVVSTTLTLIVTVLVFVGVKRLLPRRKSETTP
jgi:putative effector of murein hydrolase LrgA (UPF0299 family)